MFLADTGKKILSSIIVKAQKVSLKPELVDDKILQEFSSIPKCYRLVFRAQTDSRKCLRR